MNKPYDLLQAKPKLQLLQLQLIQFDYLQLQFVCITLLLFKDKYCKCYLGELGEDLADLLFLKVLYIKCKGSLRYCYCFFIQVQLT